MRTTCARAHRALVGVRTRVLVEKKEGRGLPLRRRGTVPFRNPKVSVRATEGSSEGGGTESSAGEEDGGNIGEELLAGQVSRWLSGRDLPNRGLGYDHQGVETLRVKPEDLISVCLALNAYGFNYLRNQCGYDSEPGGDLVSVYHLVKMDPDMDENDSFPEEVCIKVFLPREDPRVPSVYWIWKTADFQERETYDMYGIVYEGHPDLKRLLMPENWEGWPLRKDYITPDFYELQDAY